MADLDQRAMLKTAFSTMPAATQQQLLQRLGMLGTNGATLADELRQTLAAPNVGGRASPLTPINPGLATTGPVEGTPPLSPFDPGLATTRPVDASPSSPLTPIDPGLATTGPVDGPLSPVDPGLATTNPTGNASAPAPTTMENAGAGWGGPRRSYPLASGSPMRGARVP